jgi:hypothetical protein
MPLPRFIAVALLAASAAGPFGFAALAEPLDKEACKSLEAERRSLLTKEIMAALQRGPDWVKDHLDSEEIEKVRQFLLVEEKVEFRCRTDGVVIPKPEPVPLPDRKPALPPTEVADIQPSTTDNLLPLRKPSLSPPDSGDAAPDEEIAESDEADSTTAAEVNSGPSQTVADSDKTAPSTTKATQTQ